MNLDYCNRKKLSMNFFRRFKNFIGRRFKNLFCMAEKNEHNEHTKKIRRRIEEKMRQDLNEEEIEALATILKVNKKTER